MPPPPVRSRHSVLKWIAAILAIAVHVGFVLFLIFSVNWQNRKPEPVTAELYVPPQATVVAPPKPVPEPPRPEPPKAPIEQPKPPPQAEPPKPDIALKEKQERMKREQAERERKEKEKQDAEKKQQEKRLADARERQSREAEALRAQAERERQAQQQKAAADTARAKANADYIRRIQAKIRGNVVVPPDIQGNPEAVFDVVQLPTGEIIDVQLGKSSGVRTYDEAVQRAIMKSSPLPRPDTPEMFRRNLTLKFRPLD
jgi:colicin import membrane protein